LDGAAETVAMALGTILYAAAWACLNGPRLRAEAEQRMAVEVEAESRDACRRLGMPPEDQGYTACATELGRVRFQHEDRAARRSAGFR
jgi:hypothetical protein